MLARAGTSLDALGARTGLVSSTRSSFVALNEVCRPSLLAWARRPHAHLPQRAARLRVSAAAGQPILRAVARTIPTGLLAAWLRQALAARVSPVLWFGLLAYATGVTIYAAGGRGQPAPTAASSGGGAPGASTPAGGALATLAVAPAAAIESLAIVVEQQRKLHAAEASVLDVAPESLAEAVAVNAVVTLAPERRRRRPATLPPAPRQPAPAAQAAAAAAAPAPAAPTKQQQAQQKKQSKEDRNADARKAVCKVCNGIGRVSYENHMSQYDDRICPCCLVSPRCCMNRIPVCGLHVWAAAWGGGWLDWHWWRRRPIVCPSFSVNTYFVCPPSSSRCRARGACGTARATCSPACSASTPEPAPSTPPSCAGCAPPSCAGGAPVETLARRHAASL
jgi:hypothetical protein